MRLYIRRTLVRLILVLGIAIPIGCSSWKSTSCTVDDEPIIFPDYKGVTVPCNIAPLNFMVEDAARLQVCLTADGFEPLKVVGKDGTVRIPEDDWHSMLSIAKGREITVSVSAWSDKYPEGVTYKPFNVHVAPDEIDPWVSYRLIEPGYEGWRQIGIYQRDLSTFDETPIVTNRASNTTCINCHHYSSYSPESIMFHARGANGGTILYDDGELQKIDFKNIGSKKNTTYPAWHPHGRYIAFSSNSTLQIFFGEGEKPIEVYDTSSDLVLYDIDKGEVLTDSRFTGQEHLESFPAWSPDGKYLYYVAAPQKALPAEVYSMHYSICRVSFDETTGTFGDEIQIIYDGDANGGSASFPRISPDGKYLLYTWSEYGTFPIWHDEADLKMIDISTGRHVDVSIWNDDSETDSYHSWSSNGRWVVFSSRRLDGRYTRLYIAYLDEDGKPGMPFLLPQENPLYNNWRLKSYNIPELTSGKIELPKEAAELFYSED